MRKRESKKRSRFKIRGQVMLLTVLALGGTILGATTIAGLLMIYQIRQTTDLANSTKAIFAADTGIEWALYEFFCTVLDDPANPDPRCPAPPQGDISNAMSVSNGASFSVLITADSITSVGSAGKSSRAFYQPL